MPPTTSMAPEAKDPVLSTLNRDGSRRWLTPKLSTGHFWRWRRRVAWGLIVIFSTVPHLRVGEKPLLLLDILDRQFVILGRTFLATDSVFLLLLALTLFFGLFLITAMVGRVWCGWACPQTVYLEFLYRPLERLFKGWVRRKKLSKRTAGILQLTTYLLVSLFLAHTFLSYFVGTERLAAWMAGSPVNHPVAFAVVVVVTAAMCFNFGFFREQTCLVACPYGRFQSVLLDRDSLIVGYDERRGEPRGKPARESHGEGALTTVGDCVDCKLCVTTCPTGIDIRKGLQMECVHCTQCVDACDAVMKKLGREPGLIRYSSQNELSQTRTRVLRPRVIVYGLLLSVVAVALVTQLSLSRSAEVFVMRVKETPFQVLPDGSVTNSIRMKITNRSDQTRSYTLSVDPDDVILKVAHNPIVIEPQHKQNVIFFLQAERKLFEFGSVPVKIRVTDGEGFEFVKDWRVLGP